MTDKEDSFGLNIVCDAPTVASATPTKAKKRNKYEKRREKAKRAKLIRQQHHVSFSADLPSVTRKQQEGDESDRVPAEPHSTTGANLSQKHPQHAQHSPEHLSLVNNSSSLTNFVVSRKQHKSLQDEQERARYMADFHARPLEMDRKSGASSEIEPSLQSQHLFVQNGAAEAFLPNLHPKLEQVCKERMGMMQPTIIQCNTWARFFEKPMANLFLQSETGSGKTAAYLLPILQSLAVDEDTHDLRRYVDRAKGGTLCLILCPTRELASQIFSTVEMLTRPTWLVGGCLSGGEKRKSEKARLRKGIHVLVATPGRLLDHLQKTEVLSMSLKGKLKYLILDESDRLLDMGLGSQVEQIVQHVRANQPGSGSNGVTWRSLLVSATVSQKEQALAKSLLGCSDEWDWARGGCDQKVQDTSDLFDSTPRQLSQLHMTVTAKLRLASLVAFLAQRVNKAERVVVFMATCDGVDYHHALFSAMECILPSKNEDTQMSIFGSSCPIHKLHGNIPHAERQTVLSKFNSGSSAILLATDVAARGLNLLRVDWTIQYDPPCEVADYAHRAGRAARAGQAGHSLIFLLPTERQFLEVLELKGLKQMKALSLANTLSRAAEICAELSDESKTGHRNKGEAFALEIQHRFENLVVQDDASVKAHYPAPPRKKGQPRPPEPCGKLLELARRAFFSYIKSYPTKEKIVRHIFSSRALHVGHIARSFALKEPPKSSINKVIYGQKEEIDSNRKRMLIFDKNDHESEQRKRQGVQHHAKPGAILDTAKARMMLMERAKQLQQGGMESL